MWMRTQHTTQWATHKLMKFLIGNFEWKKNYFDDCHLIMSLITNIFLSFQIKWMWLVFTKNHIFFLWPGNRFLEMLQKVVNFNSVHTVRKGKMMFASIAIFSNIFFFFGCWKMSNLVGITLVVFVDFPERSKEITKSQRNDWLYQSLSTSFRSIFMFLILSFIFVLAQFSHLLCRLTVFFLHHFSIILRRNSNEWTECGISNWIHVGAIKRANRAKIQHAYQ